MHAVKILSETIGLIEARDILPPSEFENVKNLFMDREYVLITGYVTRTGKVERYAILPTKVFTESGFDYDPVEIQHDWSLVVQPFLDEYTVQNPYKD